MHSKLLIKNMVCHRCVLAVEAILKEEAIPYHSVIIGEVELENDLAVTQRKRLAARLEQVGFELIDDRVGALVEQVKQLVIKTARRQPDAAEVKTNLSHFLSRQLHHEYTYLSSLFSSVEGRTIEHYYIEQRIEYAKELLIYGQLTLSEIAIQLGYSSTAHLSSQFKKVTGLTPSYFKQMGAGRKPLDKV